MKFFVSTIAENGADFARQYGLGLEIADFCYAPSLDRDFTEADKACREKMAGLDDFWFHGPFAELCPAAIDPEIREIAAKRYTQTLKIAAEYGIKNIVFHGGYTPQIYFPEWFIPESVKFWKAFLEKVPADVTLALENVMETSPELLTEVVRQVDDSRLGLCIDMGHANLTEVPLSKWIEESAPYLRHVHIHCNDGNRDSHSPFGTGTVDAEEVLKQLQTLCPQVSITVEMMEPRSSIQWLVERGWL